MPNPATMQLATLLERYIRKHYTGRDRLKRVAADMDVTYAIVYGLLKGKNPHHENMEKIINFMTDKDIITPGGLPVAPPDVDREQLEGMGIFTGGDDAKLFPGPKKHYIASAFLEPRTFYSLMSAILSLPEAQREEVLQKLLPHEFPEKA